MDLFYSKESKLKIIGFAYVDYLSDPHKTRSQKKYVFTWSGTISWKSTSIVNYNIQTDGQQY